jgi:hypothetical protein
MTLLYKPFAIVVSIVAGLVARRVFTAIWGMYEDVEPPEATTHQASWTKVVLSAGFQGFVTAATRATIDRLGAKSFHHLTGIWPGEETPDPAKG